MVFAVIFASVTVQDDLAGTDPSEEQGTENPEYIYFDYTADGNSAGLLEPFLNPATRSLVADFLREKIGDDEVAEALLVAAEKHGVDPALVVAVSRQESFFRVKASGVNKNNTVDRGLMQLNSATFAHLDESDFYDPFLNADLGVAYLKKNLDSTGNTVAALAMYNAGPGRVGSLGAPRVTLDYVSKILAFRDGLVAEYGVRHSGDGILMSLRTRPSKNPDHL